MITRLPRWIWMGAWILAFVAGMTNVVGFLGFAHQAITHLTGTTSLLGAAIAKGDLSSVFYLAAMIGSFVAGSTASGFIVQDSTLQLGRRYGVALLIEAALLCLAVPLLKHGCASGEWLAAGACGLQNAMASTYSGAAVRTTHLSGMFTDLGIYLGHVLRGIPVDPRRLRLCLVIISAFLCGGIAGTLVFRKVGFNTLYIPAAITGSSAVVYGLYRMRRSRRELQKPQEVPVLS
ncbi:YoaK family protein [Verrucomicrobiota bacterium sgz303538]